MPNKGKLAAEEKVRLIESYLSGKIGSSEASRQAGVDHKTIARWASRYSTEGPTGFLPQEHDRVYSKETKLSAVLDYLSGKGSLREICVEYGIRDSRQLRNWLKVYNRHEDFKIHTGGSRMTKGRDTTAQERIQIVKACRTITAGQRSNIGFLPAGLHVDKEISRDGRSRAGRPAGTSGGNAAVTANPDAHPLFHSDRGFLQYTSRFFHLKLQAARMKQSMSRAAHCIDNGPMEGFWGILKREIVLRPQIHQP